MMFRKNNGGTKMQNEVFKILEDLTGEDLSNDQDRDLFGEGLLDSMAAVGLLLKLQETFDISVPVSEFKRSDWNTPKKILEQVKQLKEA